MRRVLFLLCVLLCIPLDVSAQLAAPTGLVAYSEDTVIRFTGEAQTPPPVIRVLGVGRVAMDVSVSTLAECQAQGYRAYVAASPAVVLTVTCTGTASPFVATWPLSQIASLLSPTQARSLAVTAFVSVPDGERESARADAPFTLQQAGPPVAPTGPGMRVLPPS